MSDRLVVEIGEAGLDGEIVEALLDLDRGHRQHRDGDLGVQGGKWTGDQREDWQACPRRADAQMAGQALAHLRQLLPHRIAIGDDPPCMDDHALALWGEADESVAAFDDRHAQIFFELADRRRERRLRDMAAFGRGAEMALPRERQKIDKLLDDHQFPLTASFRASTAASISPASFDRTSTMRMVASAASWSSPSASKPGEGTRWAEAQAAPAEIAMRPRTRAISVSASIPAKRTLRLPGSRRSNSP